MAAVGMMMLPTPMSSYRAPAPPQTRKVSKPRVMRISVKKAVPGPPMKP